MQTTFTEKVIDDLIESFGADEMGIFISLLSNKYIKYHDMPEKDFIKHLKNSLKMLKGDDKN